MVVIWSPLDLRPTRAIVGPTREGKLNFGIGNNADAEL